MLFRRDNNGTIHTTHVVEADTPEEAAKIFRQEMEAAFSQSYNDENYLEKNPNFQDVTFLPELWDEKLHFYSEEYDEYDSSGKLIPFEITEEDIEDAERGFVWGLKSYDDLSKSEANNFTMNDIDITYHDNNYYLSIEEIYLFDSEEDRIFYLNSLQQKLKDYVLSKGYSEKEITDLYECSSFSHYYPTAVMQDMVEMKATTLIDLYYKFTLFVVAYTAVMCACNRIPNNDT